MKRIIRVLRIAIALVVALCNALAVGEVALAQEEDWVTTHTRAHPTQGATWLGALSPSEAVSVVVSLKPSSRGARCHG